MNQKLVSAAPPSRSRHPAGRLCRTVELEQRLHPGRAQREQTVRYGVVESVREVLIQGNQTGAGTIAGGAIGGVAAGSLIGSGNGSVAAGILGAVLGGIAGSATENKINQRRGTGITVRLENGDLRAITQDADETFRGRARAAAVLRRRDASRTEPKPCRSADGAPCPARGTAPFYDGVARPGSPHEAGSAQDEAQAPPQRKNPPGANHRRAGNWSC